jgi:glycosyltransferase involved in cell wall biosynthesis
VKVGVLVVAYNAETTLVDVLDRIPPAASLQLAEVLVQDDHSTDGTHGVASEYLQRESHLNLTIVRHDQNLGYGGNQKSGYRYALDHGWDVVVLLHGDGQYAPEVMGDLIDPIVNGDADAVFGSRMMEAGQARKGGMPLYKYVGNRILSTAQNALTGLGLSEWHSGYRAYRVAALADIAFADNADGFDFDTEIILQLAGAGKKIVEIPIPTYYGDEICRVNGMAYAKDVMVDTLRYRLGRTGFGSGHLGQVDDEYAFKPSPSSSHGRILELLAGRPPARILDVGCGAGYLAQALRAAGHTVTGVDVHEAEGVTDRTDHFVRADLASGIPDDVGNSFDVVIGADVIEHVPDSLALLRQITDRARPDGRVIISVPNFGHWYPRARVVSGRFDYDQRGILDETHLRFFSRRSFLRTTRAAGLTPLDHAHTGLPVDVLGSTASGLTGTALRAAGAVDRTLVAVWPTLFAYQLVYEFAVGHDR